MKRSKQLLLSVLTAAAIVAPIRTIQASPPGGSFCQVERGDARTTDVFTIWLTGGERTTISVSGDGDTDLDLYLYDESGNLMDSDTDYTDEAVVTVVPYWTGAFEVRVVNHGSVFNRYTICFW